MRLLSRIFILILAGLAMTACQLTEKSAQDLLWSDLNDPYVLSTKDWTRRAAVYDGVNLAFAATATAKSLDWREAFAARYADTYSQTAAEAARGLVIQRDAHAAFTEIVLALESPTLEVGKLSVRDEQWKVFALQGENKLYPQEIRRLKGKAWPDSKLGTFFPYFNRWQKFYGLRFERMAPGPLKLVVSGPAGRVELGWEEFK
ncbi:hypothetical protein [Desulfovibrio ferrophilus]|uniref:Lipoprotein n=1 Tax=Desulfovibrio ferrophilus TaxID=241368 RepID=A0A2Z6B245_9BACT|nr:hypothetical protein [Desulfovibrio ferrophilus]BBD09476.1 uncharacterized protein DFE_2750 [Desulfovibrio ferrophilus]